MKIEYDIGDVFEYDDNGNKVILKTIYFPDVYENCMACFLLGKNCDDFKCSAECRTDEKDVIFLEVWE